MNNTYEMQLLKALSQSWGLVARMPKPDAQSLFDNFVKNCVNPDLAPKFYKDFDSRKRIGMRFFHHCEWLDDGKSLYTKMKASPSSKLTITALWNKYNDPIAFELQGDMSKVDQLFIPGRDAIAKLICNNKQAYLFMDGHAEAILVIKIPVQKAI